MATLLPPPKRRKLYHGIPEPVKEPELPSTSIVVQFVNEEDGRALVPAVNLPADLSREALENLLNKLSRQVIVSTILDTRTFHFDFACRTTIQYRSHFM
jgi:ribosome assembly protein 4